MVRRAAISVLAFSVSTLLLADVTGTWTGTISGSLSPCNATETFTITMQLLQSGTLVSGAIQATGPNDVCVSGTPTQTVVVPFSGTISGSTLTTTVTVGKDISQLTGVVSGSSMNLTVVGPKSTDTGTLTQTSTQTPDTGFSGTYTGTYSRTVNAQSSDPAHPGCTNLTGSLSSSGNATVIVAQVGSTATISGTLFATKDYADDGHGTCTIVTADESNTVSGTITGNVLTAPTFRESDGTQNGTLTVTFSGNSLSGDSTSDVDHTTVSATRTGSAPSFPPALVAGFNAQPDTISVGNSTVLSWSTINATSVSIDNGLGTQPVSGSVNVSPAQTTTYTLTATGPGGTATATATVTVSSAIPEIVVGTLPSGMLEATGATGATDSFTLSNVGAVAGDVSLSQNGSFFNISPSSFTIPPGSSQVVAIHANAQGAGTYDGTIAVNPAGITVAVHLLVAAPPTAPPVPQAQARSDVSATAGQNPSGSVPFTNNGTGTLTGIAVADVPWIVPQSGAITIAPGQTVQVGFNIDRSKRPDSSSPNGGMTGKLSLLYLASVAGKRAVALGNSPTASISVTIVDVVKPGTAPGSPQPLQAGQVALFVDGLRSGPTVNGDLSISGRAGVPSISDLQLFFTGGGNPTQVSAIPGFAPSAGVSFPAVVRNVFGVTGGGSLQIRSAQAANISMSAVVSTNGLQPGLSSATALPVLRSDRGIGPGERSVIAGVQDSQTNVWLQELTGNAGHVSIQYLDANGATIGTDSGDIPAFSAAISSAPDGARAVVVTNDSTGAARIGTYAVIQDPNSNDQWVLTDPQHQWGSASGALIVPLVQTAVSSSTDLYVTNTSGSPTAVSVDVESGGRHRAVHSGGGESESNTVGGMSTLKVSLPGTIGFARISSSGGPISAAGRVIISSSGASFGSSLPAVPESAALASGEGQRFTSVDDSSARTVAAAEPGTYRSTLMLVETSGQSATVRLTLRYNFIAGGTVASQGVSSRDFVVGPDSVLTINDLGRAIIGAQRDAFGDLRDMQVDVDVIDGSGKVLPFLESTDNASGDIMVRAE